MLSYQVLDYYKFVLKKLEEFENSISFLLKWEEEYNISAKNTLTAILSSKNIVKDSNGLTHYAVKESGLILEFTALMKTFKATFDFYGVFINYGQIKQDISNYKKEQGVKSDYIETFFCEVDKVFELYKEFIQSDDKQENAVNFGQGVINFKGIFNACKSTYKNLIELSIENFQEIEKDYNNILEIQLLNVEYTFEQFTKKLESINEIYSEIGNILVKDSKSIKYQELKIVKIESGSLLSTAVGNPGIMKAIGILMNKTINLVFNKFTQEGKIMRHTELANKLKEDIELGEKMKEYGYDITDSKDNIEKSYNAISKNLLDLVESSSKIKVNDQSYNLKEGLSDKYLKESSQLYLKEGEQDQKL